MKNVTIIVNSCDKYYQAWEILNYSYSKYWPDCPWDIVVMTNYLEAPMGKSTKLGSVLSWTSMMKNTLNQIETPYVLLHLDDYFFTDYIDTNLFLDYVRIMERDNITHLRITPATDGIEDYPLDNRFKLIKKDSIYRTSLSPAIWNTKQFKSFLADGEDMWQFETQGRYREQGRSLILAVKENQFRCVDRDNPDPKWHGLRSIERGEWFDGAIKYIKEEKLNISLSINPKDVKIENIEENKANRQLIEISSSSSSSSSRSSSSSSCSSSSSYSSSSSFSAIFYAINPPKKNSFKILWLYQYMPDVNYDHWFHIDFAKAISKQEGIDLRCYGLNMTKKYPEISLQYDSRKLFSDIKKEFDFDIIISNTKSRMFEYYCPPVLDIEERRKCWLPKDFATWKKTPKISLEEDYHYEINDSWYVENHVDLMLQRHYSQSLRKEHIKKIWYPFSVDNKVFYPKSTNRARKLCNIASNSHDCYPHRFKLIQMLEPLGLLYNADRQIENNEYLEWLQRFVSYICCDSIYHITPAKMLEIMASGGLLFTNNSDKYGLQKLFPKDCYFTYEEDYSDVKEKVKIIINDADLVDKTVKNALNCIRDNHTNQIRIKELREIIRQEFKI